MKKVIIGFLTLALVLVVLPMFAAFEAHVINVTAKIENALSVPLDALDFGTVFPQEKLEKTLSIALSGSFTDEDRVDDVEYFIRQKPKCGVTSDNGETLVGPTWTGHVKVEGDGVDSAYTSSVDCEAAKPADLPTDAVYGELPSLCEYISKHPDNQPDNDGSLDSFHEPYTIEADGSVNWNDTNGRLAKSESDVEDTWTIDLAVPCFGGFCAQDWADFVTGINPSANPADYTQSIDDEHKVFGCDLWVEVSGVSEDSGNSDTTTLTVIKAITNDDGGNAVISDFTLSVTGLGSVTSGVANAVTPGDYDVNENGLEGYEGTFSGDCDSEGLVTIADGENLTCTITNDDIGPTITLIKNPVGGNLVAADFEMRVNGTLVPSGSSIGVDANTDLAITEDPETNYTFTSLVGTNCPSTLAETFQMNLAESIICTITNTANE